MINASLVPTVNLIGIISYESYCSAVGCCRGLSIKWLSNDQTTASMSKDQTVFCISRRCWAAKGSKNRVVKFL